MKIQTPTDTALIIIDMQESFASVITDFYSVLNNCQILLKGFQALKAPILITEQYPEKLGATVQELTQYSSKITPIAKTCFSCYRDPLFKKTLKREYKKVTAVALAGIEAHVCLYQTAYDLLQEGYRVEIVEDAISSRTASNREIGIKRILQLGAFSTSVEMLLLEQLGGKDHEAFKTIQAIVK